MRLLIIIPAHNEAKSIGALVKSLGEFKYDILVIDDGSIDATADIAKSSGALVISTGKKSGKGNALRLGFKEAVSLKYDIVITMDGDGQHSPKDIKKFLDFYSKTNAQVITGNRMGNTLGMPIVRRFTNGFMSWMISLICHQKISDTQCGFRLITSQVLKEVELQSNDFEIETEILIKASKKGFNVGSVPIETIYRDEISKIKPVQDTLKFIRYISKEIFK